MSSYQHISHCLGNPGFATDIGLPYWNFMEIHKHENKILFIRQVSQFASIRTRL